MSHKLNVFHRGRGPCGKIWPQYHLVFISHLISLCLLSFKRFFQTVAYSIRFLTTALGKTGTNAKTKVPSHILHQWPGLKMDAWRVQVSAKKCSSVNFPAQQLLFFLPVESKSSLLIQRQSWCRRAWESGVNSKWNTLFPRQLPNCQTIFQNKSACLLEEPRNGVSPGADK